MAGPIEAVDQRIGVEALSPMRARGSAVSSSGSAPTQITDPAPASASGGTDRRRHQRARDSGGHPPRDLPMAARRFSRTGVVSMGAHNGGVDHHVSIVVIVSQQFEDALENPTFAHRLNVDGPFSNRETARENDARDTSCESVENGLDKQSIIFRRAADVPFTPRQKILNRSDRSSRNR